MNEVIAKIMTAMVWAAVLLAWTTTGSAGKNDQADDLPTIAQWSSQGGNPRHKADEQDLIYMAAEGDGITFSIATTKACEHAWTVRNGSKVLAAETEKDMKQSTFRWQVPKEKANWDIEVATSGRMGEKGPTPQKSQKTWSITTSAIETVTPGQAIQKAIDALPSEGGIVELAAGIFDTTDRIPIAITKDNTAVIGQGADSTELVHSGFPPGSANAVFYAADVNNVAIEKLSIRSTAPGGASTEACFAIHLRRVTNAVVSRVTASCFRGGLQTNLGDNEKSWNVSHLAVSDCVFTNNYCGSGNVFTINSRFVRNIFSHSFSHCGLEFNAGCDDNTIEGNIAHHNQYGFKFYVGNDRNIWRNNAVYRNQTGIFGQHPGWDNYIVGNLIHDNRGWGLAIDGPWSYTVYVESNTIVSNGNGMYCGGEHSIDAKNNVVVNSIGCGIDGARIRSTYNNVWGNEKENYRGISGGKGDISLDPLFADLKKRDFRLKSKTGRRDTEARAWVKDEVQSPCIDAGDPTDEWENEPKPNGRRVNMGAYGNTTAASKS